MNFVDISEHIGECLIAAKFTSMKVVVLVHGGGDDISMIANFSEEQGIFEVLTRSMASCFGPKPTGNFQTACLKIGEVIKPAIEASNTNSIVCCFWDASIEQAGILSSLADRSVVFAIICEHIVRVIAGDRHYHEGRPRSHTLH